jgi:hypothetical protein
VSGISFFLLRFPLSRKPFLLHILHLSVSMSRTTIHVLILPLSDRHSRCHWSRSFRQGRQGLVPNVERVRRSEEDPTRHRPLPRRKIR